MGGLREGEGVFGYSFICYLWRRGCGRGGDAGGRGGEGKGRGGDGGEGDEDEDLYWGVTEYSSYS